MPAESRTIARASACAAALACCVTASRTASAQLVAVGLDDSASAPSQVRTFDTNGFDTTPRGNYTPYGAGYTGGVRVALGDIASDAFPDLITGSGPGAPAHVKAFDGGTDAEIRSFLPYGANFTGGVFVGAGDVTGDGMADILTGTDAGAPGGHVKVFDGTSNAEVRSFLAYGTNFTGGVRVAGGDVTGDGRADIITGAGPGAPGGHVKVFDGVTNAEVRSFLAYSGGFSGGVYVAAGDVTGDGRVDIITGAGAGAPGGHVKVFDGVSGTEVHSFFAYGDFTGGVRVASGFADGDGFADIITAPGAPDPAGGPNSASGPVVKVFGGADGRFYGQFFAFDPSVTDGLFVASVPEPSAAALLLALAAPAALRRHRRDHLRRRRSLGARGRFKAFTKVFARQG